MERLYTHARKSPYLVLGQTCQECRAQCDTPEAPHFAELKVQGHVAKTVRCPRTTTAKKLTESECDLFQNMSHYVSQLLYKKKLLSPSLTEVLSFLPQQAVVDRQHTGCTLEGVRSGGNPTLSNRLDHTPPTSFINTPQLQ